MLGRSEGVGLLVGRSSLLMLTAIQASGCGNGGKTYSGHLLNACLPIQDSVSVRVPDPRDACCAAG